MKILVDTSVWVDFLNGHPSAEGRELATLIAGEHDLCTCGIVVAEVFQGLRREKERQEIDTLFRHLTFLEPASVDVYFRAAEIYRSLRQRGRTVRSTVDCLIAAIAEESGCHVLAHSPARAVGGVCACSAPSRIRWRSARSSTALPYRPRSWIARPRLP